MIFLKKNFIYHYNVKNFMAPSTAIGHRREIVRMEGIINGIIAEAEEILKKWGFTSNKINISLA